MNENEKKEELLEEDVKTDGRDGEGAEEVMNESKVKSTTLEEEKAEVNNGDGVEEPGAEAETPMPKETEVEPGTEETGEAEGEEKMLSQSEVNKLIGQARQAGRESALKEIEAIKQQSNEEGRNSYMNELFSKYGVANQDELDGIFGKGQAYDSLNDDFTQQMSSMNGLKGEVALLKSNIDESRWDDVKFILGGQGLDVNSDNIATMLPSHPEWLKGYNAPSNVDDGNARLKVLGNDITNEEVDVESEEEKIKRLFSL